MTGKLRWRGELYKPLRIQDESGDMLTTFTLVEPIWFGVEHKGGAETRRNDQPQSVTNKTLVLRNRHDVQADWKIKALGATDTAQRQAQWFDILAIARPVLAYVHLECAELATPPAVDVDLTWGAAAFAFGG